MNVSKLELPAQRQLIGELFRHSRQAAWVTALAAWACGAFVWGQVRSRYILVWVVVISMLCLVRVIVLDRRMKSGNFLDHPDREARLHSRLITFTGLAFSVGFILFGLDSPNYIVFGLVSLAVAMATGSALVFTTHPPSFRGYALPVLVAPVVLLFHHAHREAELGSLVLGSAAFIYGFILNGFYGRIHRILKENIKLNLEKDSLLEKLRTDNHELSADREVYRAASLTDKLTNTPNRRHFDLILKREWERAYREATPIACVMLDIDHFKKVNDRFGHKTGDEYLQRIARQLSATLNRGTDFLARFGGEEFVVILPNTDAGGARVIADQLREAIAALHLEAAVPAHNVTVSAGVSAQSPKRVAGNAGMLVELADAALYQAKHGGRNQVVIAGAMH